MFGLGNDPTPNSVAALLRQHKAGIEELARLYKEVRDELSSLGRDREGAVQRVEVLQRALSELEQRTSFDKSSALRPRTIDDVPGVRTPQWYTVEVTFTSGQTATTFNTVEISPEGPFIVNQVQAYWQITDTSDPANGLGRILPVSAATAFFNQLGGTALATLIGNISEVPELSFQFEVLGSGRFWTNQKVYGAALYGGSNPLYVAHMGWIDTSDRIKVHVTPEIATPHAGKAIVIFHGFQILTSLRLSQLQGFAQ